MTVLGLAELDYKTFKEERYPRVGIYYVFTGYLDKGLCREFKLDIRRFIKSRQKLVVPILDYEFISESVLLKGLSRNNIQGIRIKAVGRISFKDLSEVIADIHFDEFLKRHEWLKTLD